MSRSNVVLLITIVLIVGCFSFGTARLVQSVDNHGAPLNSDLTDKPAKESVENSVNPAAPARNSVYFTIRQDMRRCASPMCGGYFVKAVNQRVTRCANGKQSEECYVAEIDWNKHPVVEPRKALLRAELRAKHFSNFGKLGLLRVLEAWKAGGEATPTGKFYRARDRRIQCIAFPCLTHSDVQLNSSLSTNIAGVDLKAIQADTNRIADATTALGQPDGLIVAGEHVRVKGPAGQANSLSATQFYLRAKDESAARPCIKTGCSNQICAEEAVVSTCEFRMEYECYKKATCERQQDGNCGFTKTPELDSCITRMQKKSGDRTQGVLARVSRKEMCE